MSDDDKDLHEDDGAPQTLATVVLPFATAIASLALGALLGGVVGWVAKPAGQLEVQVPRELTSAELDAACAPSIAEHANELDEANTKVAVLTKDVSAKEAKVQELEAEMTRRSDRGRALVAELEAAKKELETVKAQLVQAEEEKVRLVEELNATVAKLEETEEKLDEQVELTGLAKEDALTNKWYRFLNDSQLEICEKGNRKRLGKCRETILANLKEPGMQDKFAHCVRSNQAVPSVHELLKDEQMPQFAEFLDEEDKVTKDWYVLLCDPTLPEADDLLGEEHLPSGANSLTP